jgi:molecular chaperone GrpE (heat shock protein)
MGTEAAKAAKNRATAEKLEKGLSLKTAKEENEAKSEDKKSEKQRQRKTREQRIAELEQRAEKVKQARDEKLKQIKLKIEKYKAPERSKKRKQDNRRKYIQGGIVDKWLRSSDDSDAFCAMLKDRLKAEIVTLVDKDKELFLKELQALIY